MLKRPKLPKTIQNRNNIAKNSQEFLKGPKNSQKILKNC